MNSVSDAVLGVLSSVFLTCFCMLLCTICNRRRQRRSFRIDSEQHDNPTFIDATVESPTRPSTTVHKVQTVPITTQGRDSPFMDRRRITDSPLPTTPTTTVEPTYVNYQPNKHVPKNSPKFNVSIRQPTPSPPVKPNTPVFRPVYALSEKEKHIILGETEVNITKDSYLPTAIQQSRRSFHSSPESHRKFSGIEDRETNPPRDPIPLEEYFKVPTNVKRNSNSSDYSNFSHYGKRPSYGATGSSQYSFADSIPGGRAWVPVPVSHQDYPFRKSSQDLSSRASPYRSPRRDIMDTNYAHRKRLQATSQSPAISSSGSNFNPDNRDHNPFFSSQRTPRQNSSYQKRVKRSPMMQKTISIIEEYEDPFDVINSPSSGSASNPRTPTAQLPSTSYRPSPPVTPAIKQQSPGLMRQNAQPPLSANLPIPDVPDSDDETHIYVLPFAKASPPTVTVEEYL
uniref:Uncharacterized LOC100179522 n=1 Tax=Ciona intestinalis TaxID=7719 RepID=F7ARR6_CIOIN|nr:uncharacterized protein LOC100179522 [Ciona intestinalis]|eukprot:XP_002127543.1 uncharacterized protein LOC100179522 [Ciona intestinalis]